MQHGHGKLLHYEGTTYEGIWERGNKVEQEGAYMSPNMRVPLKTTEYRLKEAYRVPTEYQNSQNRIHSIQVDSAYFNQNLAAPNPNMLTSSQGALHSNRSGLELQRFLQDKPQPVVYTPSPLRFSGQQQLSSKLLSNGNNPAASNLEGAANRNPSLLLTQGVNDNSARNGELFGSQRQPSSSARGLTAQAPHMQAALAETSQPIYVG